MNAFHIDKGPQVKLDAEERKRFLQHYVEFLTMRYLLPSTDGRNYDSADVKWWSDVACSEQPPSDDRVERVLEIVHETVSVLSDAGGQPFLSLTDWPFSAIGFAAVRIAGSGERPFAEFAWDIGVGRFRTDFTLLLCYFTR